MSDEWHQKFGHGIIRQYGSIIRFDNPLNPKDPVLINLWPFFREELEIQPGKTREIIRCFLVYKGGIYTVRPNEIAGKEIFSLDGCTEKTKPDIIVNYDGEVVIPKGYKFVPE